MALPARIDRTVPDRNALQPRALASGYWALARSRPFLAYALVLGALLGALFGFITAGPFIMIEHLGVATQDFGYYQAAIVLALFLGILGAARAVDRVGLEGTLRLGLGICALGGVVFLVVPGAAIESPSAVAAALCVFAFGLGFAFAAGPVRALAAAPGWRGMASALLGTIEMVGAGLGALAVTGLNDGTSWPAALVVGGASILAGALYLALAPCRVAVSD